MQNSAVEILNVCMYKQIVLFIVILIFSDLRASDKISNLILVYMAHRMNLKKEGTTIVINFNCAIKEKCNIKKTFVAFTYQELKQLFTIIKERCLSATYQGNQGSWGLFIKIILKQDAYRIRLITSPFQTTYRLNKVKSWEFTGWLFFKHSYFKLRS